MYITQGANFGWENPYPRTDSWYEPYYSSFYGTAGGGTAPWRYNYGSGNYENWRTGEAVDPLIDYQRYKEVIEPTLDNNSSEFAFEGAYFISNGTLYMYGELTRLYSFSMQPPASNEEDPYQNSHGHDVFSAEEFWLENRGKSYSEIINQEAPRDGLPGGPSMRMVVNPNNGRIMDMRHVMVIGFGGTTLYRGNPIMGNILGIGAEIFQWFGPIIGKDTRGSAFDMQDLFSNNLGAFFGTYYWYTGKFTKDWSTSFYNWINKK